MGDSSCCARAHATVCACVCRRKSELSLKRQGKFPLTCVLLSLKRTHLCSDKNAEVCVLAQQSSAFNTANWRLVNAIRSARRAQS
eukprot:6205565-Pleurochrysis_carterae.AAC.1